MCTGAILWSGLSRIVYAAKSIDVEGIVGFDEGPVPSDMNEEFAKRNIEVVDSFIRDEACRVLELYKKRLHREDKGRLDIYFVDIQLVLLPL